MLSVNDGNTLKNVPFTVRPLTVSFYRTEFISKYLAVLMISVIFIDYITIVLSLYLCIIKAYMYKFKKNDSNIFVSSDVFFILTPLSVSVIVFRSCN